MYASCFAVLPRYYALLPSVLFTYAHSNFAIFNAVPAGVAAVVRPPPALFISVCALCTLHPHLHHIRAFRPKLAIRISLSLSKRTRPAPSLRRRRPNGRPAPATPFAQTVSRGRTDARPTPPHAHGRFPFRSLSLSVASFARAGVCLPGSAGDRLNHYFVNDWVMLG